MDFWMLSGNYFVVVSERKNYNRACEVIFLGMTGDER
jgi:hypothetical protein